MTSTAAVFIGHGSPTSAIEPSRYTAAWSSFAASVPKPKAILSISAHWYIGATAVTAMDAPRTIHDFYGFPDAMFAIQYPAPGSKAVADRVSELVTSTSVLKDTQEWGLDHGTWSPLLYMYPQADVPVLQLAINGREDFQFHFDLGKQLAPLADEGVMIMGSGNVVHNLGKVNWSLSNKGYEWAQNFDEYVREIMFNAPDQLPAVTSHPDYKYAVPTPDHFIPLLYLAGVAATREEKVFSICEGYDLGALSMTSYRIG